MPVNLIYSEKFLQSKEPGHPESPERLSAIVNSLKKNGIGIFREPSACKEEDLLHVHSMEHLDSVRQNKFYDPDTPNIPGVFEQAMLACGAALNACELSLKGDLSFSLGRPPGHHAGKNSVSGFCYFNNIAVAVKKLVLNNGQSAAILDIDGHHGNGTQEIFAGQNNVIYISIHQFPGYPGTGKASFGNCYNFPVTAGVSCKDYLNKFDEALEIIGDFSPDILALSAGFDAHRLDPLLDLPLEDTHYYTMGERLSSLNLKTFAVLEGGYNLSVVGNTCYCFIKGLTERSYEKNEK